MEKKQSSIEWLYNNLKSHFEHDGDLLEVVYMSFEQAKAMHNEEIKDAWYNSLTKADYLSGDEYYNATFADQKKYLTPAFFADYGFSEPIRYWNDKDNQFSIYYKIDGFDCDILVSPMMQVVGNGIDTVPIKMQIDDFSDMDFLKNHNVGNYKVYINSFQNPVACFQYEFEMLNFMSICGRPLKYKNDYI